MKNKLTHVLFTLFILLSSLSSLAMNPKEESPSPLKRSKIENNAQSPENAYRDALDKAVQTKDEFGMTALHAAAFKEDYTMCKDLLSRGASVLVQDIDGNTPLHYAVEKNLPMMIQLLTDGMPTKARKQRIMTFMCIMQRLKISKDVYSYLLSFLPELIIAYPKLCNSLIAKAVLTKEQLASSIARPQLELLVLANNEKLTAYDKAKATKNSLICRMTNPDKRAAICAEEIDTLLTSLNISEHKEN